MLWFFADMDYFLGDLEAPCGGCSDLLTHEYYWEDGEPAVLAAEEVTFEETSFYLHSS